MLNNPPFRGSDPRAECDRCGIVTHLSDLSEEWTGLMVCHKCLEPRHPQEFLTARGDQQFVPNARHVHTSDEAVFVVPTFPPDTSDL
jgi:hypothetical protein